MATDELFSVLTWLEIWTISNVALNCSTSLFFKFLFCFEMPTSSVTSQQIPTLPDDPNAQLQPSTTRKPIRFFKFFLQCRAVTTPESLHVNFHDADTIFRVLKRRSKPTNWMAETESQLRLPKFNSREIPKSQTLFSQFCTRLMNWTSKNPHSNFHAFKIKSSVGKWPLKTRISALIGRLWRPITDQWLVIFVISDYEATAWTSENRHKKFQRREKCLSSGKRRRKWSIGTLKTRISALIGRLWRPITDQRLAIFVISDYEATAWTSENRHKKFQRREKCLTSGKRRPKWGDRGTWHWTTTRAKPDCLRRRSTSNHPAMDVLFKQNFEGKVGKRQKGKRTTRS